MNLFDLIIIGGGPAGAAAAVYASRKQIKTLLITDSFGGQSIESDRIENWIGTKAISGIDLAKTLKEHVFEYAGDIVKVQEGEKVEKIEKKDNLFMVKTTKGSYESKTVLVATGSSRRKLTIPGAKEFEGKGITYCASCDGPFFADKDVVVIGGGNAGFESAAQLLAYCKSVILLSRGDFKADPITVEKVIANKKIKALQNAEPVEIKGDKFVESIVYRTTKPFADIMEVPVQGVFVEVGNVPTTYFVEGLVELDEFKRIKIDHRNQKTSVEGLWAAGDCTDTLYHQNNIAAGDAVKALEDIYLHLHAK